MYREWAFFKTLVDNAQLALREADMLIAAVYATLADPADREAVFPRLDAEYRRTEAAICRLTGQRDLLDEAPWLQRSIRVRNPYIDPMNYVQVALLRRLRGRPRRRRSRGDARRRAPERQRHRRGAAEHGLNGAGRIRRSAVPPPRRASPECPRSRGRCG